MTAHESRLDADWQPAAAAISSGLEAFMEPLTGLEPVTC